MKLTLQKDRARPASLRRPSPLVTPPRRCKNGGVPSIGRSGKLERNWPSNERELAEKQRLEVENHLNRTTTSLQKANCTAIGLKKLKEQWDLVQTEAVSLSQHQLEIAGKNKRGTTFMFDSKRKRVTNLILSLSGRKESREKDEIPESSKRPPKESESTTNPKWRSRASEKKRARH